MLDKNLKIQHLISNYIKLDKCWIFFDYDGTLVKEVSFSNGEKEAFNERLKCHSLLNCTYNPLIPFCILTGATKMEQDLLYQWLKIHNIKNCIGIFCISLTVDQCVDIEYVKTCKKKFMKYIQHKYLFNEVCYIDTQYSL